MDPAETLPPEPIPPAIPEEGEPERKRGRPTIPEEEKRRRDARRLLWQKGVLSWKFEKHPWAQEIYDFIKARKGTAGFLFIKVHRRGAKSTTAFIAGIEECLRKPRTAMAVICKTKEQAAEICEETLPPIFEDCPTKLQPRLIKNNYIYKFDHNGSKIVVLPAEGFHKNKSRGRKYAYVMVTEACFIDGVDGLVRTLLPTLRDVTGETSGTMVIESTPPDEPNHPSEDLWKEAELEGNTYFLPLSKNKFASPQFIAAAQKDSGGADSITYRREYELESVYDLERLALPEFTKDRATVGDLERGLPPIVREVARPAGVDRYASLDPGGNDLTACLWAFYDPQRDLFVVEDELTLLNMTSDTLADSVKTKELDLWGTSPTGKLSRFSDNNNTILLTDLWKLHGLSFTPTGKDNKDAQINLVRLLIRRGRIAIHPRCKQLIRTMHLAKRARVARKGFMHLKDLGHADLLDALIYLVRNIRRIELPEETYPSMVMAQKDIVRPERKVNRSQQALARALGLLR